MPGYYMTEGERGAWLLGLYQQYLAAAISASGQRYESGLATNPRALITWADEIARLAIQATVKYQVGE